MFKFRLAVSSDFKQGIPLKQNTQKENYSLFRDENNMIEIIQIVFYFLFMLLHQCNLSMMHA